MLKKFVKAFWRRPMAIARSGRRAKEDATAKAIFRIVAKRQLFSICHHLKGSKDLRWDRYFEDGKKLYEKCVKNAQEAAPYAKPMNTFKLHQIGLASADLLGVYLGRHTRWLPPGNRPVQRITVSVVFDSDIHGETNQKICQSVFEGLEEGTLA